MLDAVTVPDRDPSFAILDVITSHRPGDAAGLGVVCEIRWYLEGRFRYSVGPLDSASETGGMYDEDELTATGRQVPIEHFWTDPSMARQIVRVTEAHPKPKLRGLIGEVTDPADDAGTIYSVAFTRWKSGELTTRMRDVPAELLELTGHRQPPEPVPRPVATYRPGRDQGNLWPSHVFDIVDELDQYL
jgi:hypothetical protein